MVGRRRNLFILLFVVGLTIASVLVIISQPTKLGLDLRGGTSLVYQGEPTPQSEVNRTRSSDRSRSSASASTPWVSPSPTSSRWARTRSMSRCPGSPDIENAVNVIGTTAQLYFYDWEPNVIAEDPNDPNATEQGFNRLFDAVKFASTQKPECFKNRCTTNGPTYYLFDRDSLELLTPPSQDRPDLFVQFPASGSRRTA